MVAYLTVAFFGFFVFLFGLIALLMSNTVGIILIILGCLCMIVPVVLLIYFKFKKKKDYARKMEELRKAEEAYFLVLDKMGFKATQITCDFMVDTENKKWCKKFSNKIFDFSDTISAKVSKHRSSATRTSGSAKSSGSGKSSSHNGIFFNNYRKGTRSSQRTRSSSSTRTSEDTSTYEVLIQTKDLTMPLVVIDCGRSLSDAETITATVDIIIGKKQRNKKVNNDAD